jgi:hypothetical protein
VEARVPDLRVALCREHAGAERRRAMRAVDAADRAAEDAGGIAAARTLVARARVR